jgi:hypothetical protein
MGQNQLKKRLFPQAFGFLRIHLLNSIYNTLENKAERFLTKAVTLAMWLRCNWRVTLFWSILSVLSCSKRFDEKPYSGRISLQEE